MNVGSSIVAVACKPEWSINPSPSVCVQGALAPSHRQPSKLLQRLNRCLARRSRPALATQMHMGPCLKRWARVVDGHWRSATDMGDVFRSARVVLEVEMLCMLRSGDRRLMRHFEQRKRRGQIILIPAKREGGRSVAVQQGVGGYYDTSVIYQPIPRLIKKIETDCWHGKNKATVGRACSDGEMIGLETGLAKAQGIWRKINIDSSLFLQANIENNKGEDTTSCLTSFWPWTVAMPYFAPVSHCPSENWKFFPFPICSNFGYSLAHQHGHAPRWQVFWIEEHWQWGWK